MILGEPLRLLPRERATTWGGRRLTGRPRVGELWVAHAGSVICNGTHTGTKLAELVAEAPGDLLGDPIESAFPFIVKLLDTADWLSVQVHPDDAGARAAGGAAARGKTEAWHIIEAAEGAEMVTGIAGQADAAALRDDIARGEPLAHLEREPLRKGDSVLIPARTIHTMSGGVLAYEVQQASNTTYRAYDWGRDRELHRDEFWKTVDPKARVSRWPDGQDPQIACEHFRMQVYTDTQMEVAGGALQMLTAIDSEAIASGEGWAARVSPLETVIVPACLGSFTVESRGRAVVSGPSTRLARTAVSDAMTERKTVVR